MTDWLDRSECDFTLRGRFGESIGVAATSAPVTGFRAEWPQDTADAAPARPEPPDEAHEAIAEARRSIHRAITAARVARDALTLFIADADRALDELNGGGW